MVANQFEIPGLDDSIKNLKILGKEVENLTKDLLKVAIEGEKAMAPFKNTSTIKTFADAKKVSAKATDDEAKASALLETAEKKLAFAQSDVAKKLAEKSAALQRQNQENKTSVNVNAEVEASLKKQITTIQEANAQNALLRQAVRNVDITTTEGKAKVDAYNAVIDKNTAFVKNNVDAAVKQKMEIGNYAGALEGALAKTGIMTGKIGEMTQTAIGFVQAGSQAVTKIKDINDQVVSGAKNVAGFTMSKLGLTNATKASTSATQIETTTTKANTAATESGKVAKIGFQQTEKLVATTTKESTAATQASASANKAQTATTEANAAAKVVMAGATEGAAAAEGTATVATNILNVSLGVLLFPITLLIAAFGVLVYIFKDFAPLINPIKDAFSALGAVFATIKQAIFDLVTGARSLKDIFSSLGSEMGKAATEAKELAKAQRDLTKAMDVNDVAVAQAQTRVQQLILQSKDRSKSERERIDLINQAQAIEEESFRKTNELNNKGIEIARKKLFEGKKLSEEQIKFIENNDFARIRSLKVYQNLDNDELNSYKELLIKKESLAQTHNQIMEKAQNRENQMAEKAEEKDAKAKEEAKKRAEDAAKKAEEMAKKAEADREKERQKALDNERKSLDLVITSKKSALDATIAGYKQEENSLNDNLSFVKAISMQKQDIANLEQQKSLVGIAKGSLDYKNIIAKTASDIEKIKNEESTAIENISKKNIQFELDLYDFRNQTLIEEGADLTDILVQAEKDRLKEFEKIHLEALAKELKIDDEKVKAKFKNQEKLSENELKYLKEKQKLEKQTADASKKVDAELLKAKEKLIDEETKREQKKYSQFSRFGNAYNGLVLKSEAKNLRNKLKLTEKGSREESDILKQLADNKISMEKAVSDSKKDLLMMGLDFVMQIAGKESEIGKAIAIAKITMDTIDGATKAFALGHVLLADPITAPLAPNAFLQGGLIIAEGAIKAGQIAGIKMFAEGTDDAPYTGKAVVDELGAELHFDKNWNLKSKGSDDGARLTDIVKGDKIIPADISALLQYSMYTGGSMIGANSIDYNEIGNQFKKHLSTELKKNKSSMSMNVIVQKNITDRVNFRGKSV